jgi:hypothetical protein
MALFSVQDRRDAPDCLAPALIRSIVAIVDAIAATRGHDALVPTGAPETFTVQLSRCEMQLMCLAHIMALITQILVVVMENVVWRLARDARFWRCTSSPAEKGQIGEEVLCETLIFHGLTVSILNLVTERSVLFPDVCSCARRRDDRRELRRRGWVSVVDSKVHGQALFDNVAGIDLSGCFFGVALGGWAWLAGVNGMDDVGVHGLQQASDNVKCFPLPLAVVFKLPNSFHCSCVVIHDRVVRMTKG